MRKTFHFFPDPDVVSHGIPHVIHFGDFREYKILAMTKTGPSLGDLHVATKSHKFLLKTICKIAIQAVSWLAFMHIWIHLQR